MHDMITRTDTMRPRVHPPSGAVSDCIKGDNAPSTPKTGMQRVVRYLSSAFSYFRSSQRGYTLLGRLDGHSGAVNCLSFTQDGMLLASGSDDETVRIWDIETLTCLQAIRDPGEKWGQITCVKWLNFPAGQEKNVLCFGTGRGLILIFRSNGNSVELVEATNTRAFNWGDSTEAMAFDATLRMVLVSSHYGKVKMYSIQRNNSLVTVWEVSLEEEIPRSLLFTENGRNVLVFGLEKGTIVCRDARTGAENSVRTLTPGIGNAVMCPKGRHVVVDNLTEGFDIYTYTHRMALFRKLYVPPQRRGYFVRGVAFGEAAQAIICGSDHGNLYVFSAKSFDASQNLVHADGRMIQAIDTVSMPRKHLIASGISEGRFDICIWVKLDGSASQHSLGRRKITFSMIVNILMMIVALWATSDSWLGLIKGAALSTASHLFTGRRDNRVVTSTTAVPSPLDQEAILQLLHEWRRTHGGVDYTAPVSAVSQEEAYTAAEDTYSLFHKVPALGTANSMAEEYVETNPYGNIEQRTARTTP